MSKEFNARRLDVKTFAEQGGELSGASVVRGHERLMAETEGRGADLPVTWSAQGELRNAGHVDPQVWLRLRAEATVSLVCQRCLTPVEQAVSVDRSFRFVADEATAEALDDESDEDLLALSRTFDLIDLVEDELLMEMPVVPRHDACPVDVPFTAQDPEFAEEEPSANPFAILGKLKGGQGE
ncbi:MAG TPA: YceD family protein [Ramlibacter sp.]|nr:YceD family protein [Ramlibacter sp.]